MSAKNSSLYSKINTYLLLALVAAAPLVILPLGNEVVTNSKNFLLFAFFILALVVFSLHLIKQKVFKVVLSPLLVPLGLVLLATLASTFLTGPFPVKALMGIGGVFIVVALLPIFSGSVIEKNKFHLFSLTLAFTSAVLAVTTLLEEVGFGPSRLVNLLFKTTFTSASFNLSGSVFVAAQVMLVGLVVATSAWLKEKDEFRKKLYLVTLPIITVGLLFSIWFSLPGKKYQPTLLPHSASWSIVLDTLRSPRSALIGSGPESFSNSFTKFRPLWLNGTDLWGILFVQGSNTPFTMITSMGLLTFGAWVYLVFVVLKEYKKTSDNTRILVNGVLAIFAIQLFFPPNAILLTILSVALAFWIAEKRAHYPSIELHTLKVKIVSASDQRQQVSHYSKISIYIISAVLLLASAGLAWGLVKTYTPHYLMYKIGLAASRNDIETVYNLQQQSIQTNPYLSSLRRNYALTNLSIALAISNKAGSTEQDVAQATAHIQQAIRESKQATILDPNNTQNWILLADIYRNLIGAATGADQWAVNSYVSAIETDPKNPSLRVALGNIFYQRQQFDQAEIIFQQAVELKQDLPISHYSLANALRENRKLEESKLAYQRLLVLLEFDSEDYLKSAQELQIVQGQLDARALQPQAGTALPAGQDQSLLQQNIGLDPQAITQPTEDVNLPPANPVQEDPVPGNDQEGENVLDSSDL